eukprot:1334242-Pleurochrysis_carterae.AAC.5
MTKSALTMTVVMTRLGKNSGGEAFSTRRRERSCSFGPRGQAIPSHISAFTHSKFLLIVIRAGRDPVPTKSQPRPRARACLVEEPRALRIVDGVPAAAK